MASSLPAPAASLTLDEVKELMSDFARARDWEQYHTPRNVLLALTGEVGELCELFQWRGEVAPGLPQFSAAEKVRVGEELADVLLYLVRLADRCDVNLSQAVVDKVSKNAQKYPVEKARGSAEKYTAYQTEEAVPDPAVSSAP
jgi:dCTP diphosphatase